MARKKPEVLEPGEIPIIPVDTAIMEGPPPENGHEPVKENGTPTNGDTPPNYPKATFAYFSDATTRIETAVWEGKKKNPDTGKWYSVFSVSLRRAYRKEPETPGGKVEWVESKSFRAHDLPVALHALNKAYSAVLDLKAGVYFG